jgi:hypothetical protein
VRADGVPLRRYGSSFSGRSGTSWECGHWQAVLWWPGHVDLERAIAELRSRGYDLYEPSPVPIDQTTAGPFLSMPSVAKPI